MSTPEPTGPDPSVREDGKHGRYEVHRSRLRRRWWVRSVSANNKILSNSEQLNSRAAALANIEAQRGLVDAPVEDKT